MKKMNVFALGQSFGVIAVLFFSAFFIFVAPLHGAEPTAATAAYALTKGTNEFGLWAGGSPDSSKIFGTIEDRKLLLSALRYGRVLAAWESISLEYTLDILPAV